MASEALGVVSNRIADQRLMGIMAGYTGDASVSTFFPAAAFFQAVSLKP